MRRTGDLVELGDRDAGRRGDRGSAAEVTRTSAPVITSADAQTWHTAGRRLRGLLRGRGADCWLAEDLAQETLTRAVAHQISFEDADDLMRWCVPVANNLLVSASRRLKWAADAEVPDQAGVVDVEREVLARLDLDTVIKHIGTLSTGDRSALLSGLETPAVPCPRQEAVGQAVRRHRARQRLARLVSGAAAVWGICWGARPRVSRPALVVALPAIALSGLAYQLPLLQLAPPAATGAASSVPAADREAPRARAEQESAGPAGGSGLAAGELTATASTNPSVARTAVVQQEARTGDRLEVGTTKQPAGGVLVCVEGLPVVADTCVVAPTGQAASGELVVSARR